MADRPVVLSFLCAFCLLNLVNSTSKESRQHSWILCKWGNHGGKGTLGKDAQALSLDGMPTIARRRNSDNRYQRECDDMVDIITFLDERKVLSLLPHYAFDCSDHFPSAHLDEGDMRLLLRKLDNMQEELMATRKLVQQAKQGKSRFSQMLYKVHPPLKMTLRTVDPVILSSYRERSAIDRRQIVTLTKLHWTLNRPQRWPPTVKMLTLVLLSIIFS